MNVLHLTPSTNGYEEVILLANRYSKKNHLAVISVRGEVHVTGGIIIPDTPRIRTLLDKIPRNEQYQFLLELKQDPYVKLYYEE